jgi:hypothetical protein
MMRLNNIFKETANKRMKKKKRHPITITHKKMKTKKKMRIPSKEVI